MGKNTPANTVHHIVPGDMGLFYVFDNMISLCGACHNMMHDRNSDGLSELGREWEVRFMRSRVSRGMI